MMIRALHRTSDGKTRIDLQTADFATAFGDKESLLWIDLVDEPPEVCAPILRDTFKFHPLAVADALEETHVPKIDDWSQYLYLVLHDATFDQARDESLSMLELDIFLGENYLVTYHVRPIQAVDRVWAACQLDDRHLQRGVGHLLYRLADELVADYMGVVDAIDDVIDRIEDQIFGQPEPSLLEQIFTIKRALLHMRRSIAPQREVLNKLARGDYAVIDAQERVFYRDVYDHLVRLYDITESLRDLVSGGLDTYLSVVNNRMNDVMKTLTVITTLFMPLAFLTGFFGMNFFQPVIALDAWTDQPAFLLVILVMLLIPYGMFLWMRRRAWM
jgi:magnesium transporter